jgi:hypothetical protein
MDAVEGFNEKEWLEFEKDTLDNPKRRQERADRVVDSWIRRRPGRLRKRSKTSKKHS